MTNSTNAQHDLGAIKALFYEVLELRSQDLDERVDRLLGDSTPQLRDAVEQLIEAHDRAAGVLLDDTVHDDLSTAYLEAGSIEMMPRIVGYEIGEEIGRGGFGIVYRAMQRTPIERAVAVKALRRELVSEDAIMRFRAESALLARMSHESIAKVYDAGLTEQGQPFVAMELLEGDSLVHACESHNLDVNRRVAIMADVCDAVHHAHQRAVIHRDLKPANVLVEKHGAVLRPRVIDFGIAKLLDADPASPHTQASVRLGTPRYMSPEQRAGGETADTRIDVYALGAMLCELLAGDVPTGSASQSATTPSDGSTSRITRPSRIATEQTTSTRIHPKALRGDLDRIVLKACATDPELRYPSAMAMGDDLRHFLAGRPISAAPPSVSYVARKFVRRHRASVSLAGILGIALVAALVIAGTKWHEANQQRDRAIASTDRVAFIGDFLLDMLLLTADANVRGASPGLTEGTMQAIADRAAEGLEEDPEHMIDMLAGIGWFQTHAGETQAGVASIKKALAYAVKHYGVPSAEVVELRVRLHDVLWGHGLEGWKDQIRLADQEAAALYTEEDPKRLRVVQRADGSMANQRRILGLYERLPGVDPADHCQLLFAYSMNLRFGPTPEKQLETTARLYEIAKAYYPPDNTMVIDAMVLYGEAQTVYQPNEAMVDLLLDAYERSSRVLGHDHFTTESVRRTLARAYGVVGRPQEGIPYAIADVESVAGEYGTDSIQSGNALYELGRLYLVAEQFSDASEVLERALEVRRSNWSVGHFQITTVQVYLAQALLAIDEDEAADAHALEAIPYLDKRQHARTYAVAMNIQTAVRERAGDAAGAEELRREARTHLEQFGFEADELEAMIVINGD